MQAIAATAFRILVLCVIVGTSQAVAFAQDVQAPAEAKHHPDPYGSPLDTLMSTRLWTDVPPAKDFVTSSRPDSGSVDYAPLVGTDPDRPKPRDPAGIKALQAELESGGLKNAARAKGLRDPAPSKKKVERTRKSAVAASNK
jgi:hypothetical protein